MTAANASRTLRSPHLVIDDFLSREAADTMLAQMIAAEAHFVPSVIGDDDMRRVDEGYRSSRRLSGRCGVDLKPLAEAIDARLDAFCAGVGINPFSVVRRELSVVAHGDGDFYKPHIDTRTGASDDGSVRVVSCVYYLHRAPRAFSGGELAIHPIAGDAPPVLIEPVHNRLVIFPSFIPHEVLATRASDAFADCRFSVNCWLRRARRPDSVSGDGA